MALERYLIDGWEVTSQVARNLERFDGLHASPALLGDDGPGPAGRDGVDWSPKRLGPGGFSLHVWLAGDTRQEALNAWERLLRAAVKRHRLVAITHHLPDGSVRECYGYVSGRIEPQPIGGLGMRAAVEFTVPSGVWRDTADLDTGAVLLTPGTTSAVNKNVSLTAFAGASAPITAIEVTVAGMVTGLQVTCPETGEFFAYDVALAAGQSLVVNAVTDTVTAPSLDQFRYKGPYMIEAIPPDDPAVAPVLNVTATQADPSASIRVTGRRHYLI